MGERVLVVQNDPVERLGLYQAFLVEEGARVDLLHAYAEGSSFPDPRLYDRFVVGPTPIPANGAEGVPFLRTEMGFLRGVVDAGKPVLGVCCGGQILARVLGGSVTRSPGREVGGYRVELTRDGSSDPLFRGFPVSFPVFHWHRDMFTPPPGGRVLAAGNPCPIQAFGHGSRYGVIFHLEIGASEAARWTDAYPEEMLEVGKTREQVLGECRGSEEEMTRLARLLTRNFLQLS